MNELKDIIYLLKSENAELPIAPRDDLDENLRDHFKRYFEAINDLDGNSVTDRLKNRLADMNALSDSLIKALDHWLDARPDKAMKAFKDGLKPFENEIKVLVSNSVPQIGPMYRVRIEKVDARYTRDQMFHIKFEERDRVRTQRYSFPGLPCLYLGRSVYVCWEELGRPELSSLWISRFDIREDETVKVLDFGYRPALIAEGYVATLNGEMGLHEDHAVAYAVLWPLIAACSVKRDRSKSTSFVVEYVLPQLLLWWITEREDIDGIRYFSTHIEDHDVGMAGMNYVFPAQERHSKGHCPKLLSKFCLTEPVNWQIAMSCPDMRVANDMSENNVRFELAPNKFFLYHNTDFGRAEAFLRAGLKESLGSLE